MNATGTLDLADRPVDELSGGQRQRVWIAMALAQQTDVLLLDEPTTFLDVAHQVEVLDLLTDLNRTRGTTVVIVLHDLNLAARYADHLIAMKGGTDRGRGRRRRGGHRGPGAGGVRHGRGCLPTPCPAPRWSCRSVGTTPSSQKPKQQPWSWSHEGS